MKKNETDLHVKYRPQTLADMRGNSIVVESLKKKLAKKDLPHAFLFYGSSGIGKTTMGRIIATSLGCKDLDVKEINAANNNGIDYIRGEVIRNSWFKSFGGGNKVYLFDEAHCLTQDASNALLKIVEEPPKHAYFIFCTTDPKKILPALKNRCIHYKMLPLTDGEVLELLECVMSEESIVLPDGVKELIAHASKGVPRQALVLLDMVRDVKSYGDAAFLINQATEFSSVTQAEEPAPQRAPSNDKALTSAEAPAIPAETPVESSNDASSPDELLSSLESWRYIRASI